MGPVSLSDTQMDLVYTAARMIAPGEARDGFPRATAAILGDAPQPLGDGQVARAIRDVFDARPQPIYGLQRAAGAGSARQSLRLALQL